MAIIRDNPSEMEFLMTEKLVKQARTNGDVVKYAERLAEKRMKTLQVKFEDDQTQQMEIESWQEKKEAQASKGTFTQEARRTKHCQSGVTFLGSNSSDMGRPHEGSAKPREASTSEASATSSEIHIRHKN